MFKKLNNYLFVKRAGQYLSTVTRESRFVTYDKARSVLILFESDFSEKNPVIRKIISSLQEDGMKVSAWGYTDKKEVSSAILPDFRILNKKQADFFGQPLESFVNELENNEYDLLLDLTMKPLIPMQYLAVHARAVFKTGIHKSDLNIYDFVMDVESLMTAPPKTETTENEEVFESPVNETYVFEQIIFYLKSIQTKD